MGVVGVGVGEYAVVEGPKRLFRSLIFHVIKMHVKGIGFDKVIRFN